MPRLMPLLAAGLAAGGLVFWRSRARSGDTGHETAEAPGSDGQPAPGPADSVQPQQPAAPRAGQQPPTSARAPAAAHQASASSGASQQPAAPSAAPQQQAPRTPAPERLIKGNVHGERQLYHLPDDDSYNQVLEDIMFATPEEAEAAGYRHAGAPTP